MNGGQRGTGEKERHGATGLIANEPNKDSSFLSMLLVKGHSHFNLFINGCREVELGKRLPFFGRADAVVGQLLHRHSVNAFRLPDPVVHLQKHQGNGVSRAVQQLFSKR